jgi:hypothetical protein
MDAYVLDFSTRNSTNMSQLLLCETLSSYLGFFRPTDHRIRASIRWGWQNAGAVSNVYGLSEAVKEQTASSC